MLVIGNKKYRNLQEQVGWNTEQINKIFEFLDGINVSDNVVVVLDISTPLTAEELEIVNREVAFIVYNGELYFKRNQDSSYIYFDVVFSVSGSTVITLASSKISVTKSNGALGITNSSSNVYSKTQVDTLLSSKADISYVDAQLALKANLSGADFTGAVTAPTFKQSQFNFSRVFNLSADQDLTISNIYNRFAEINNVLHLIVNISLTNNTGESKILGSGYGFIGFASLTLDQEIASKIIDIDGISAAAVGSNGTLISSEPCQIMKNKILDSTSEFYTGRLSILNRDVQNVIAVQVALNGGAGNRITIADGETIYVTARMALTLL